jgi:2-C-methyl-D-erythritol 4-phosphate cytidylyltransferase/2-C-methyl-D-erythritol 2,4-cyclodiphosphate synthase
VAAGLRALGGDVDVVLVHDGARPFVERRVIDAVIAHARAGHGAVAAVPVSDTLKQQAPGDPALVARTIPRDGLWRAQTPQAFPRRLLEAAYARPRDAGTATDDAALVEACGAVVHLVPDTPRNLKITTADDLEIAERLLGAPAAVALRIGNGYDLHRLVAGRPLVLGGVTIPFEKGLDGHSDADAVCHAVTDAILGAAGAGDIGRHFPDTDPAWKDANSLRLLERAAGIVADAGYRVVNVDVVVIAQRPKLAPHAEAMQAHLARAIGIAPGMVSVKGKTNEGVDSTGAGESIAAHAVALLSHVARDL